MRLSCIWTWETNYIAMLTVEPQREHLLVWGREPVSFSNPVFILNLSPLNLIKWPVVSAASSLRSPQRRRFPFGRQAGKLPLHRWLWKAPSVLGRPDPGSCIVHPPDRPLSAHHLFSHPWCIVRLYPDELPVFTVVRHFVWGQWRLHGGVLR